MNWMQQLLSDPAQREAIGWVAGGIAALASGVWVVFRFLIERKNGGSRSAGRADASRVNQTITASGSAVAAGRDANIGVKGVHVVILVLFLIAILLFGLSAFGDNLVRSAVGERLSVPQFALSLSCGSSWSKNPYQISEAERQSLVNFVDFIERNQGKAVYLDVRIDQECAACQCARSIKEDPENPLGFEEPYIGELYIDGRTVEDRKEYFAGWGTRIYVEGIELMVFVPDYWAVSHAIFLPRPEHLSDPQYRSGEYGAFARFDGLFTARFAGGTGGNALHLDVLNPTEQQDMQLRCIREGAQLAVQQRLQLGC